MMPTHVPLTWNAGRTAPQWTSVLLSSNVNRDQFSRFRITRTFQNFVKFSQLQLIWSSLYLSILSTFLNLCKHCHSLSILKALSTPTNFCQWPAGLLKSSRLILSNYMLYQIYHQLRFLPCALLHVVVFHIATED